jgi:hypothetical protein
LFSVYSVHSATHWAFKQSDHIFVKKFPPIFFCEIICQYFLWNNFRQKSTQNVLNSDQGPMLCFFKYFRRKILRTNWRFWFKTKPNFEKNDHCIGFWKNANFFAENWGKSQKIVIITSTPVLSNLERSFFVILCKCSHIYV